MLILGTAREADVREAVRLATSYAQDTIGVPSPNASQEELENFYAKCHEGFGLSQDLILKAVLTLEPALKELRRQGKALAKGRKQKELLKDDRYQAIALEGAQLAYERQVYRRVSDVMAWQILGMNRVLMRSTLIGHDHEGYLSDQNVQSITDAIAGLKKPGDFYLMTDLTSCLGAGVGDLIHVDARRKISVIEVKSGTENERISELLGRLAKQQDYQADRDTDPSEYCLYPYRDLFQDKNKRAQVDRVIRQMKRTFAVLAYDKENIGEDLTLTSKGKPTGRRRRAHVLETKDEHASKEINEVLAHVSTTSPYFSFLHYGDFLTYLITDNVKSAAFSPTLSSFVRTMNARHMIYHALVDPECAYGAKDPARSAEEFRTYSALFLLDWRPQAVSDPTAAPPFLLGLRSDYVFDLLAGRKSIFIHLDRAKFVAHAERLGADHLDIANKNKPTEEFCGIEIRSKNGSSDEWAKLGWSPILRMMIEFQQPDNVIAQIIEGTKQSATPPTT